MRMHRSWPKWAGGIVLTGLASAVIWWQTGSAPPQVAAAPPETAPARTQNQPAPPAPPAPASDTSQWVVAYIHGSFAITREMLGEYLIARMGAERLPNLINQKIIEHECRQQGITVSAAEVEKAFREDLQRLRLTPKEFEERVLKQRGKTLYEYKEDVIRLGLLMTHLCKNQVQVTEDDLHRAYEARYGEKVECQLIFWSKEKGKEAHAAYAQIRSNPEEFDHVAGQQDIPNLAATHGRIPPLGRFTTDSRELENAAFSLKPGEVSPLIKGKDGGWLLLKCLGRIPAQEAPREKVRADLEKEVFDKKLQEVSKTLFLEMKKRANPQELLSRERNPHRLAPEVQLVNALVSAGGPAGAEAIRPSADYAQRVVAYIYGDVPITRAMLGDYLIARFGTQRLDALLNKMTVEYECRQRGIDVTPEEVEAGLQQTLRDQQLTQEEFKERLRQEHRSTLYEWKEDVIRPRLLLSRLLHGKVRATEEEIRMAYEAHHGEKVECQIILWPKEEEKRVLMMYATLRDNPQEFEKAAAMQASPGLARIKGRIAPLGRYSTGNPEMEKVAFSLKPGEISRVLGVPEGLLILKCLSRKPAEATPLEQVRAALEREVIEKKMPLEIRKLADELRKTAKPVKILKDREDTAQVLREVEEEIGAIQKKNEPPRP